MFSIEFDEHYTAHDDGFKDANDYYLRAIGLPHINRIRRHTLIIHAQDDPFIPFDPFKDIASTANSFITLLAPEHGGHVGFIADRVIQTDRIWAEIQIIEHFNVVDECHSIDSHNQMAFVGLLTYHSTWV